MIQTESVPIKEGASSENSSGSEISPFEYDSVFKVKAPSPANSFHVSASSKNPPANVADAGIVLTQYRFRPCLR
jgi:hypothetical protein